MFFQVVPSRDRTLYRVLKRGAERRSTAGEALWRADEPVAGCVYVLEGLVAVRSRAGRTLSVAGAGHLTALEALHDAHVYQTQGEALSEVVFRTADGAAVLRALRRGIRTLPLLLDGLHGQATLGQIVSGGGGGPDARARLAAVVLDLGRRLADGEGWLPRGLTHQIMGELAGLHRATVTTHLNDWIYRDWLGQHGRRLRIVDAQALERIAHVDRSPGPE